MATIELATPIKAKHDEVTYKLLLDDGLEVSDSMPAAQAEAILNDNEFKIEGGEIFNITMSKDSVFSHFIFASNDFKLKRTHKENNNDKDGDK